jgi:hypothetical protein
VEEVGRGEEEQDAEHDHDLERQDGLGNHTRPPKSRGRSARTSIA